VADIPGDSGDLVMDEAGDFQASATHRINLKHRVITNDVSVYMNLLVRITYIICNHTLWHK